VAVGRRRGTRPLHTQSLRGSMQEGKERAREGEALTPFHVGHGRHVPAANVLVERTRIIEHCARPTHATSNTNHQHKNEARSEFKKIFERSRKGKLSKASEDQRRAARERTGAVGRRRGTRPLHTQSLPGSMQEGTERAREGRHLLFSMLVTVDTSHLPISWSNELALPVYPYRKQGSW
jgi:hypothetical protein